MIVEPHLYDGHLALASLGTPRSCESRTLERTCKIKETEHRAPGGGQAACSNYASAQ